MSGIEYRYRFAETGVGCAEHADPTCLCDVVITQPVAVSSETLHYEFAPLIEERVGSPAWWAGILACHDLEHYGRRMTERGGLINLDEARRPQFLLDLVDETMSGEAVGRRYGVTQQVVNYWRRAFGVLYVKSRIKRKHRHGHAPRATVAA